MVNLKWAHVVHPGGNVETSATLKYNEKLSASARLARNFGYTRICLKKERFGNKQITKYNGSFWALWPTIGLLLLFTNIGLSS